MIDTATLPAGVTAAVIVHANAIVAHRDELENNVNLRLGWSADMPMTDYQERRAAIHESEKRVIQLQRDVCRTRAAVDAAIEDAAITGAI